MPEWAPWWRLQKTLAWLLRTFGRRRNLLAVLVTEADQHLGLLAKQLLKQLLRPQQLGRLLLLLASGYWPV